MQSSKLQVAHTLLQLDCAALPATIVNMVVRIRLSRFGNKHQPFYNIIVAQARSARDSKPLEVLGTYNPLPQRPTNLSIEEARKARAYKEIALDRSRAKYWLGVGAQPTDTAWRLMELAGLVESTPKTKN